MRNRTLVVLLCIVIFQGCSEETPIVKTQIDYSTIFVSSINQDDSFVYTFTYENDKIKTIVGRTEANFNDQRYLVDSTLFFYKNEFLDSAIVYRYKRNFLPIKTLENYTQPIGILFMAQFGTTTINDTIHLNFQNDQNKITLQKSDKIITVIGPESNTQLDLFQFTFEYDKQNRLVVIQPNNQTLQYNNLDNVEMDCLYNMCTHYWKYDNNINPFKAINDKLGIPYFIEGLSRNNPLFYIRTSKNEIPVKLNNFYQYDAKGRPVLINDKITIKYKDA